MSPHFYYIIILENEVKPYTSSSSINKNIECRQEIINQIEMKDSLDINELINMFSSLKIS